ncbi:MAG: type II toxin-antitoxin system PemK/MazF family toxin [Lachnospiraceae bacterium]|jgi:mRNA interferase MazF|nr:type II toxin-antitoxin system PemK/MazF family toxin [Lachnospiraceae bacterium]
MPDRQKTDALEKSLAAFEQSITSLGGKQQRIMGEWLEVWGRYIAYEKTFDPKRLVRYKRGDVVHAHFGYNVGSEIGGAHYAVVVENGNDLSSGIVTVVPISSLEAGKALHKSEVPLGKLIGGVDCYAMPLQIRTISKLRIIKPKRNADGKTKVSGASLDLIDELDKENVHKSKITVDKMRRRLLNCINNAPCGQHKKRNAPSGQERPGFMPGLVHAYASIGQKIFSPSSLVLPRLKKNKTSL